MLTREGAGQKFVTACFALAISEATLERLFLASIKNFLIDEAKKTPRGKLRRRIARLMSEDTSFRRRPGSPPRWALSGLPEDAVWQGDLDDLIAEASRVDGVGITRWNRSGPTPRKTVQALMTVLMRVLRHAQGAVREEDLAKVLESRFGLLARPVLSRSSPTTGHSSIRPKPARWRPLPTPRAPAVTPKTSGSG